jgi:hypothetical protein
MQTVFKKNKKPNHSYRDIIISLCFLAFLFISAKNASALTININPNSSGTSHTIINDALNTAASGDIIHLNDGTYWLDAPIIMPSNRTLEGSRNAILKLVNGAGWSYDSAHCYDTKCVSPVIKGTPSNITLKGFTLDGNCSHQGYTLGKEYYKLITFKNGSNITITGMAFLDGCADGVNIRGVSRVTYTNNYVKNMGHEALYAVPSSNITISGNTVYTRTNTAFRFDYDRSQNIKIFNNYINGASSSGPGIELAHGGKNIEIYNNRIVNTQGAGIWMMGETGSSSGVSIHNNCFENTGQGSWNYGNAAIVYEQFTGSQIYNNYFNDAGTAAVRTARYVNTNNGHASRIVPGTYTATITNNTILNTTAGILDASTAPGVNYVGFTNAGNCIGSASGSCPVSCAAATGGVSPSPVGGGISDPGDPSTPTPPPTTPATETNCHDGVNEDNDAEKDCHDSDCKDDPICQPAPPYNVKINPAPLAIIAGKSSITRATDSTITLNGTHSIDFNGTIVSYSWDFNAADGVTNEASGATATHVYNTPGTYVATLTVRDNQGAIGMAMVNITIKECEGNGDVDGDGFLNVGCGGDDCDDNSSAVGNKGACLNICSGNIVLGGVCQEGTGQCVYDTTVSTCENLGETCKMDACQISADGNAACVADVSDDLCSGGLVPCGKQVNNPATTGWDESAPCDSCSMILMGQLTIEFLVQIAAIFATLVIIIGGFLYIFAVGQSSTIDKAKSIIKYTLIGFVIIFIAWSIVNSILATVGYIDPLGGNWYTICEN